MLSFFLLLVSCTPHPNAEIGDGGLLSDASCGPPCFWNITPGLTTRSQAWGILTQRGMSQACQEQNGSSESGSRTIHCEPGSKTRDLGTLDMPLDAHGNKILSIIFNPSRPILLQDLIKKYGGPSHLAVYQISTPQHPAYWVILYYDAILTSVYLYPQAGSTYQLRPDAAAYLVTYSATQSYRTYLDTINTNLQEWKGYGAYTNK